MTEKRLDPPGVAIADLATCAGPGAKPPAPAPHRVFELRQYKIVPGRRDDMIALFEREFVETQEAVGIGMLGQFRDLDDQNRFTWIRSFEDMSQRARALQDFYFGPVWATHRDAANPLLEDNDNVFLLKPSGPNPALAVPAFGVEDGLMIVQIHYLWKDPSEGFAAFFEADLRPAFQEAGQPVLAAFAVETSENTFPRLPVRAEKVFVWMSKAVSVDACSDAVSRLEREKPGLHARLRDFEERPGQILRLQPTRGTLGR